MRPAFISTPGGCTTGFERADAGRDDVRVGAQAGEERLQRRERRVRSRAGSPDAEVRHDAEDVRVVGRELAAHVRRRVRLRQQRSAGRAGLLPQALAKASVPRLPGSSASTCCGRRCGASASANARWAYDGTAAISTSPAASASAGSVVMAASVTVPSPPAGQPHLAPVARAARWRRRATAPPTARPGGPRGPAWRRSRARCCSRRGRRPRRCSWARRIAGPSRG